MKIAFGFLIALTVAVVNVAGRQIGYLWSFEELAAKADTIVIAEHIETVEVRRGGVHPDLKPALQVVEMESMFEVLAFLKHQRNADTPDATKLRLRHYRIDMEEFHRREGPLKGLLNAGSSLDFGKEKGPYLLFLKRGEGHVYQPLSGHTFPTESVRLVRSLTR